MAPNNAITAQAALIGLAEARILAVAMQKLVVKAAGSAPIVILLARLGLFEKLVAVERLSGNPGWPGQQPHQKEQGTHSLTQASPSCYRQGAPHYRSPFGSFRISVR